MNWFIDLLRGIFGDNNEGGSPTPSTSAGNLEALIIALEGSSSVPYADTGGLDTIGVGHLIIENDTTLIKVAGSDDVNWLRSNPLANSQVRDLLNLDLQRFRDFIKAFPLSPTQYQEDALVSLTFNIGTGAFNRSTLKKYWVSRSSPVVIADQFPLWRKSGGKVEAGLQMRRAAEATIFLGKKAVSDYYLKDVPARLHRRAQAMVDTYWGA